MTTANRRALAALLAGAAVALGLVGCSAGQLTQTADQVAAVPGANVNVGAIALRDLQIVYGGPEGYAPGGNVPLIVRIFNEGTKPVKLVGASATGTARSVVLAGGTAPTPSPSAAPTPSASASAAPSGSASAAPSASASAAPSATTAAPTAPTGQESFSIVIPAQSYVLLVPGAGQHLQLAGLNAKLTPGMVAKVTFMFDDGSKVTAGLPFAPAPDPVRGPPVVEEHAAE